MNVALILARGGSKGIPKKNIYPLLGKPLISYTIECARDIFDDVYVSTNDEEISKISEIYGAKIIKRPDNISGDKSKSEDALLHFAQKINFNILTFIQPTSPLLKKQYLVKGLKVMQDPMIDSVFSVTKKHWIPEWKIVGKDSNFNIIKPNNFNIENRPMRQDVEQIYLENGAFYMTRRDSLLKSGMRYSGNISMIEMLESESFQVDTLEDIKIIESLLINTKEEK